MINLSPDILSSDCSTIAPVAFGSPSSVRARLTRAHQSLFLPSRSVNTNYSQAAGEKGVAVLSQNLQAQAFTRNVINLCHLVSDVCLFEVREGYSWLPGTRAVGIAQIVSLGSRMQRDFGQGSCST